MKGLEVLQSTCQWFNDRIEQVALEEKQLLSKYGYSEEVRILAKSLNLALVQFACKWWMSLPDQGYIFFFQGVWRALHRLLDSLA